MSYENLDPPQMAAITFDKELGAQKVTIVGLDKVDLTADMKPVVEEIRSLKEQLNKPQKETEYREVPVPVVQTQVVEVEKTIVVTETKIEKIQVPHIVKETVYREIPVTVVQTRFEKIEVPVITTVVKKELPLWAMIVLAVQSVSIISYVIAKLIRS